MKIKRRSFLGIAASVIFGGIPKPEVKAEPFDEQQAIDAINDFTHVLRVRELVESSPAAISIPFGTLPTNVYIKGPAYRIDMRQAKMRGV